ERQIPRGKGSDHIGPVEFDAAARPGERRIRRMADHALGSGINEDKGAWGVGDNDSLAHAVQNRPKDFGLPPKSIFRFAALDILPAVDLLGEGRSRLISL